MNWRFQLIPFGIPDKYSSQLPSALPLLHVNIVFSWFSADSLISFLTIPKSTNSYTFNLLVLQNWSGRILHQVWVTKSIQGMLICTTSSLGVYHLKDWSWFHVKRIYIKWCNLLKGRRSATYILWQIVLPRPTIATMTRVKRLLILAIFNILYEVFVYNIFMFTNIFLFFWQGQFKPYKESWVCMDVGPRCLNEEMSSPWPINQSRELKFNWYSVGFSFSHVFALVCNKFVCLVTFMSYFIL
jgi:hypothetical protein